MDRLTGYEVFVAIVERGGFSRAARSLGMSVAMVSTHISSLEARVGARLLNRSTRRVELTADGQRFLADARAIVEAAANAEAGFGAAGRRPVGRVRIDVPGSMGLIYVVPALAAFRSENPGITLDLSLGDRGTVLRTEGCDIVVRVGDIDGGDVAVTRLSQTRFVQVASPEFLARYGTPTDPDDLLGHDCILYASNTSPGGHHWRFEQGGRTKWLRPRAVITLNHGDAIRQAAIAGIGIAQTLEMLIEPDLESGRLVRLLNEWNRVPVPVNVFADRDRAASPAVAATLAFLVEGIRWSRSGD